MFREMRRIKQQLSTEEAIRILEENTSGVLSVIGDDGYPYGVPLSYVYDNGRIIFHSAVVGHKVEALKEQDKVSFCVIDRDEVIPEQYTTDYQSVIAFGKARILKDAEEVVEPLVRLSQRFNCGRNGERNHIAEITNAQGKVCVIVMEIEHITGKRHK